ncbi:hypothetical protein F5J12DRAFT_860112 [Pisolithus orientalis]|uniref:uncharacterized protein n=1 Tax=Pisolithus orientalis TaxID=936130 RepID=UPI002225A42F|nr:uncharacterized protein F5J12DRAFT_860112 [Pisolithus orientalis]KAI5992273.1 hypothetical protein F5J12DRAFT_860112 [Pisolithus orientalis]
MLSTRHLFRSAPARPSSAPGPSMSSPLQPPTSASRRSPSHAEQRPTLPELEEDLPPAYTPAADPALGEETIEVGPRRPFQPPPSQPSRLPPPLPSRTMPTPMSTPDIVLSPPTEQPQWYQAPGQAYRSDPPRPQSQSRPYTPQHHTWTSSRMHATPGSSSSGGGLIGNLVNTVRDVVDALSGAYDDRVLAAQQVNRGAYASSYPPNPQGPYAPSYAPPAPARAPGPVSPISPPASPPSRLDVPDDGRPTRVPVPGHPLLRDGMLLCWEKYGKPYTGALAYAPWPFPRVVALRMGCIVPPSNPNSPHIQPPRPSAPHLRSISEPPLSLPPSSSYAGPSYYIYNPSLGMGTSPPVPHAQPIPPGDPRLGGQMCLRCGGAGTDVSFLFDLTACQRCGGVGRVWT